MRRPTSRWRGISYAKIASQTSWGAQHRRPAMKTNWKISQHTVGVDLGDRKSVICRLDAGGDVVQRRTLGTTQAEFEMYFRGLPRARVVIEVGTHSPWISRLLKELGHEVIVANPAKIRGKKG